MFHGDGHIVMKELDPMFWKEKLIADVARDPHDHDESDDKEKCLVVAVRQVHGVKVCGLLDTGATSNDMSPTLVE